MRYIVTFVLLLVVGLSANAVSTDELENLVGYTIVASKTIDSYYDTDPDRERGDGFEGCDFDRVILFTDGTKLTCAGYGYQYAYMPTAIIFAKKISHGGHNFYDIKMLVEDEIYDMRQ